jgi:hypothetical protein
MQVGNKFNHMKLTKSIMLFLISVFALSLNACNDVENVPEPGLSITTSSSTYKVGESVKFDIEGNADFIKFFSGEKGNDYDFNSIDRVVRTIDVNMAFRTEYQNGGQASDLLRLVYSTNFDGDYSVAGINKATWTDITNRCLMPTAISNNNNPLGFANSDLNIYDLFPNEEAVVYFAFKYHIKGPSGVYGQRTNAIVTGFKISYKDDEDKINSLMEQSSAAWKLIRHTNYENEASNVLINDPTKISFSCGASPQVDKIAYAITPAINVPKLINQGPDWGVSIKDYQASKISSYSHKFLSAGQYEVVFVASNAYGKNIKGKEYRIKLNIID